MKNVMATAVVFLSCLSSAYGQDQMFLNDSTKIECKVDEIAEDEVKYRPWANLEGPFYFIDKRKVSFILFQNGTKANFSKSDQLGHTIMIRAGVSAFNPVGRNIAIWGQSGSSYTLVYHISCFLDSKKSLSLTGTFYGIEAKTKNIENKGVDVYFFGLGFNTKWDYHWFRWPSGSLYSGLGVGYFQTEYIYDSDGPNSNIISVINNPSSVKEIESGLGFQVDIIGIQYAPFRRFGFFAEMGVGYEGAFQLGIQTHW